MYSDEGGSESVEKDLECSVDECEDVRIVEYEVVDGGKRVGTDETYAKKTLPRTLLRR